MAKQYEVVGSYVAQVPVAGPQGNVLTDFNQGAILPSDVPKDRIAHLLSVGLIAEVGGSKSEPAPVDSDTAPAKSASKADWKAYAQAQGMSDGDAETATRDDLVELYASK